MQLIFICQLASILFFASKSGASVVKAVANNVRVPSLLQQGKRIDDLSLQFSRQLEGGLLNDKHVIVIDMSSNKCKFRNQTAGVLALMPRGGGLLAGYNPFGYFITSVGLDFLEFDGSLDSDVGRLLASLKSGRKRKSTLKSQWLEIMRVSKTGQSLRIYRRLDELIELCLNANFIN